MIAIRFVTGFGLGEPSQEFAPAPLQAGGRKNFSRIFGRSRLGLKFGAQQSGRRDGHFEKNPCLLKIRDTTRKDTTGARPVCLVLARLPSEIKIGKASLAMA